MTSDDRGVQSGAAAGAKTSTANASGYGNTAGGIAATLIPGMTQQFTNPQGYGANDLSTLYTNATQATGGATGALTGEAELNAARTRNTGSTAAIMDQAQRRANQQLSQNRLGIDTQNAILKQKQREEAASQLGSLYGTDVEAQLKSLGLANDFFDTQLKAGQSGWEQQIPGQLLQKGLGMAMAPFGGGG